MKDILRIYKALLKINFSVMLAYRSSAFISIFVTLFWSFFNIAIILLLTSKTRTIFGWTGNEIIALTLAFNVLIGVFHAMFSSNFERLPTLVDKGQLDGFLLKPVDSQFLITFQQFRYFTLVRTLILIPVFWFFLQTRMHITPSFFDVLFFCILAIFSLMIIYSTWLMVMSLVIWFPKLSNLVELLYSINGLSRWPPEIFRQASALLYFFILPLTLVLVVPLKVLLKSNISADIFWLMGSAVLMIILSRIFWVFALRHYTSANG